MERSLTWCYQISLVSIFTPRYLTILVGYSLLPHNFIFKSPSSLFCLDLKITISVFLTLSEILFAFNQLTRCFKSALTSLFSFLIELLWHNRLVPSAKWWTLQNFIAWFGSFIYNKNIDWLLTYVWEVWLDKILHKHSLTQSNIMSMAIFILIFALHSNHH